MMKRWVVRLIFVGCVSFLGACMDYGPNQREMIDIAQGRGLFITNEGNFMYGNASLSYYNIEQQRVENDVFFRSNAIPLGDVAQSIAIRGENAYVVVNNSGVVFVIDKNTFQLKGKITGLTSPRYIHFLSDTKAYVTDLYAFAITIINPQTYAVTGHIDVRVEGENQHPTEQMVQYGDYVFTNCWSYDNKILVIDTQTDRVVDQIEVGRQPTSLVIDKYNKIWTVTDGGYPGSPGGSETPALYRIDAATHVVERIFRFKAGDYPSEVCLNGTRDELYFINRDVWCMSVQAETLPATPFLKFSGTKYYGLTVDPQTSEVYVGDAIDYMQQGVVYRFTPDAMPVDTFRVGIIPGAFCFKN